MSIGNVSKRDLFAMSQQQIRAGREMWQRSRQVGKLAHSSFDAEEMAPKTWIIWVNSKGEEIATIECELYVVGRKSDAKEGVGMLITMCPKCGGHLLVREDNKQMSCEYVTYRKAPKHLQINWAFHCRNTLGKPVMDGDRIPVISSSERWACDYCREWCVKVSDGVAVTDMTGVTQLTVHGRPHLIGQSGKPIEKKSYDL